MNLMKIKHVKIIVKWMSHDRFQRDIKDFSITEQRIEENRKSKNKIALKKYLSTILDQSNREPTRNSKDTTNP